MTRGSICSLLADEASCSAVGQLNRKLLSPNSNSPTSTQCCASVHGDNQVTFTVETMSISGILTSAVEWVPWVQWKFYGDKKYYCSSMEMGKIIGTAWWELKKNENTTVHHLPPAACY